MDAQAKPLDVSKKSSKSSKRNRTYGVRVKGVYSGVPGLQDLIGMGYHTFGGFWNMPRPWENPHCKMTSQGPALNCAWAPRAGHYGVPPFWTVLERAQAMG